MNKPLEKSLYKYLQKYKEQVCEKCTYRKSITCDISKGNFGCLLNPINEKKMCKYLATMLTSMGKKR